MTLYRKSRRPFTEAEERMWHYLTEEARQVVPVDGPVYQGKHRHDTLKPCQICYLIDVGDLVDIGEDSTP